MNIITLAEAKEKFLIQQHMHEDAEMFEDMLDENSRFYVHTGDLVLDEHFILDTDTLPQGVAGYIIDGNLEVNGSIINEEGDYGPVLYVRGNVKCRSMLIGGSPTHITGNVTAEEMIMLHYNHGWMKCPGIFTAPVMIVDDYHFEPDEMNISGYYANNEFDDVISPDLQKLLYNKLTTTYEQIRYDLAAGEYVLRPGVQDAAYWERKVRHNFRDLERVPLELRTMALCMEALHISIFALAYFPVNFLTPAVIATAVNISGMALRHLPDGLITKELCYTAATKGAVLDLDIPEQFYEPALIELIIQHGDWQMERVPPAYITEDLLVIYVKSGRGAWLDKYCTAAGVSKQRVLQRVIADGIQYLDKIFSHFFSAETYGYSKALYENDTAWPAIIAQYQKKLERL